MKTTHQVLFVCLLTVLNLGAYGTNNDKSGGDKVISTLVEDNLYVAGSSVTIDAVVKGDLTAAGWSITVNDSIYEDVLLAGSDIQVNGVLGDDAKIAGRNIQISKNVHGDLIISGASVHIHQGVEIDQNLIVFAGEAIISGTVKGQVKVSGGRITFDGTAQQELSIHADEMVLNGSIHGPATLVSNGIETGAGLAFKDEVRYWSEQEELDLATYAEAGVNFDETLDLSEQEAEWRHFGLGPGIYWLLYSLSVILTMVILVVMFSKAFSKAGEQVNHDFIKNFGFGILYFIGLLLISLLCFVLIIGIPIGLVTLVILAFSLMFAKTISSMVIAHGINTRYEKNWDPWRTMLVALVVFLVFKLASLIPLVGRPVVILIIITAFGSLFLSHTKWKNNLETQA